eukprot:CAMPEP_0180300632 /NCGR_PEP_ID=MMETSP0988-20121125/22918_1 /TAXON_ID=697907 /ORGANISM="non described non described, Strain CCMP2293" /LENGTH=164 /DNA_ID=CAMNT_0022280855 /DNA_START=127 /DNA_END=619 /DNA_ORIENTATION=+
MAAGPPTAPPWKEGWTRASRQSSSSEGARQQLAEVRAAEAHLTVGDFRGRAEEEAGRAQPLTRRDVRGLDGAGDVAHEATQRLVDECAGLLCDVALEEEGSAVANTACASSPPRTPNKFEGADGQHASAGESAQTRSATAHAPRDKCRAMEQTNSKRLCPATAL